MNIRQAIAMIEFHRRAERAYRLTNQPIQAEQARQARLKIERLIETGKIKA
jgi:hypothetical protein